jgi:thiamine biosynthesis protein ThiC
LVVGDTFENSAEIYFDFNFPIITNVEQTTIDVTASTDGFALNSNLKVFPNPAEEKLYIESDLVFDSVVIYDLTGKEIQRIVSTEERSLQEIDVVHLKSGIYYLSIHSGNAKTTRKFLKK